ncbi:hypothetical protein EHQ53_14240 [Leptospira langatensis]|uniref:Lipoprotein n=1 Tax=Leptospira langatensis TaxID=2484983 RepID=A0ABY2M9B4_9LEPT|nr:hypothetical protein [Leptospira langatensis]TGL39677.1 hypothetical protein EHQ53_14240 [Leptospira langatensis]
MKKVWFLLLISIFLFLSNCASVPAPDFESGIKQADKRSDELGVLIKKANKQGETDFATELGKDKDLIKSLRTLLSQSKDRENFQEKRWQNNQWLINLGLKTFWAIVIGIILLIIFCLWETRKIWGPMVGLPIL